MVSKTRGCYDKASPSLLKHLFFFTFIILFSLFFKRCLLSPLWLVFGIVLYRYFLIRLCLCDHGNIHCHHDNMHHNKLCVRWSWFICQVCFVILKALLHSFLPLTSSLFLSLLLLLLLHDCCCLFGDKQHCINFSYHSAPTLLQQLTNHIHPITSHCTDQAAYLCLSMLLLLHSTQPPPALVLLCLYAPWGVFISKLITLGGLLAMVPACYLSLCCEFHFATRYCYSRQLYQQGAIFPK